LTKKAKERGAGPLLCGNENPHTVGGAGAGGLGGAQEREVKFISSLRKSRQTQGLRNMRKERREEFHLIHALSQTLGLGGEKSQTERLEKIRVGIRWEVSKDLTAEVVSRKSGRGEV